MILGDPIDQVVKSEFDASHGEVFASPEAVQHLVKVCNLMGDQEEAVEDWRLFRMADHKERCFDGKRRRASHQESFMSCELESMLRSCDDLDSFEL